jgi:hypothetical protein
MIFAQVTKFKNIVQLVDLLESIIDLMLVLFHVNLLWFFEWVEVVRELQPAYSVIITFQKLLIELTWTVQ